MDKNNQHDQQRQQEKRPGMPNQNIDDKNKPASQPQDRGTSGNQSK